MLSYQHIYHAGNLADVHKHALLAAMLKYMTAKAKPLSYIETHAGRAVYDLASEHALKTGEAVAGIERLAPHFQGHPYGDVLRAVQADEGPTAYPGSPMIAARLLRPSDTIHLAELHPGEHAALDFAMSPYPVTCYQRDGFALAHSLVPPTPRRGLMLIDPSYEIKTDYDSIPKDIRKYARAWNVGVVALWYPILTNQAHSQMIKTLSGDHPDALRHEVRFAPAREGHGMIGSGMFILNPPYGTADEAARLTALFKDL